MSTQRFKIEGPLGRFDSPRGIPGHDLPAATLGALILWFGWFGFNGGSTLALNEGVPLIIANTCLAGAFGGALTLVFAWRVLRRWDVPCIINGVLAGLVSITACCAFVSPIGAAMIGMVGGLLSVCASLFLERLRVDDAVGAIPVHGVGGAWGTLAVAFFAHPDALNTGLGFWDQLGVQALGCLTCFSWSFGLALGSLWMINRVIPLRVSEAEEREGLNVAEHDANTELHDLLIDMETQHREGDFRSHVRVEPYTEIGQIATQYNRVLSKVCAEMEAQDNLARALQRSEEHIKDVLNTACDAFFSLSEDGNVLEWSLRAEEMLGHVAAEARGRHVNLFFESSPAWEQAVAAAKSGGQRQQHVPVTAKCAEGRTFPAEASIAVNWVDGAATLNIFLTDVTQRKEIEIQLRSAQKMESIGQLAAGIAHEINTPVQYIGDNVRFLEGAFTDLCGAMPVMGRLIGAAKAGQLAPDQILAAEEAVRRADVDYLSAEVPKAIEQTLEGVNRVAKIVSAMKEFSHPGNKEKTLTDLNHAIETTLTVARNEYKYVADLTTFFDETLPAVPVLPGEFNQVVLNLVVNAAHAISDRLKANGHGAEGNGRIAVRTRKDGEYAEIRVEDTGMGIPEDIRDKIFDPFFTTKEVGKGTGQGLAIARSTIVDKHGGALTFETESGRGTTFVIRLPLKETGARKTRAFAT